MLASRPIDTSLLCHGAGELELGQGDGELFGRRPVARASSSAPAADSRTRASTSAAGAPTSGSDGSAATSPKLSSTSWRAGERRRAEPEQGVRAGGKRTGDLTRDREDLSPLLEREVGRDQRAAALAGLDDYRGGAETRDDPVPGREAPRRRLDSGRVLRDDQTARRDLPCELAVRRRVVTVDAAAEHGDGDPACLQRPAMGFGVDTPRKAADDDQPGCGKLARDAPCDLAAIRRAGAGADDRHCGRASSAASAVPRRKRPGGGS